METHRFGPEGGGTRCQGSFSDLFIGAQEEDATRGIHMCKDPSGGDTVPAWHLLVHHYYVGLGFQLGVYFDSFYTVEGTGDKAMTIQRERFFEDSMQGFVIINK